MPRETEDKFIFYGDGSGSHRRDGGFPIKWRRKEMNEKNNDSKFDTLVSKCIDFGKNNFVEIARKRVSGEDEERDFISLTRGYYANGDAEKKRYTKCLALPDDADIVCAVADTLKAVASC